MPIKDPVANREYWKAYRRANKVSTQQAYQRYVRKLKIEVLTHYSPNEKLCCSWAGCVVDDIDVLSLDHVNNDGKQDRASRKSHSTTGTKLYANLRKESYPAGYQTLCMNHQLKKEILRARAMK